jgi:hypothetical protein
MRDNDKVTGGDNACAPHGLENEIAVHADCHRSDTSWTFALYCKGSPPRAIVSDHSAIKSWALAQHRLNAEGLAQLLVIVTSEKGSRRFSSWRAARSWSLAIRIKTRTNNRPSSQPTTASKIQPRLKFATLTN